MHRLTPPRRHKEVPHSLPVSPAHVYSLDPARRKGSDVFGRTLLTLIFFVLLAAQPASAKTRVAEFKGTGNTTTAIFRVESPWLTRLAASLALST